MLDVPEIHSIRVLHQRGFSKRQIAKMLGISRSTVDKYTAASVVVEPAPRMRQRQPRPAPKLDRWKPMLDQWLAEDEQVPRKQRRTARRMYRQLVATYGEAVDVSEVTVRRHVARRKQAQAGKAFVPLAFAPGAMGEMDFGHALVELDGERLTLPYFAMRLMHSTASFLRLYRDEKLESLLDGVASALSFLGGVPQQVMFDNPSTAVKRILAGGRRLQTPEFRALAAHYGFEAVFANPASGNEKGGVESLVKWAQRNVFSPVLCGRTLAELNEQVLEECLRDARSRRHPAGGPLVMDLWEQEQAQLGSLPTAPFPACRHRFVRVDKTLLVVYDGARYSAPAAYVGKGLVLRAYWDHIELADGGKTVAVHQRQRTGGCSLQLEHYLPVLAQKPRAVTHAAVIANGEPVLARYRDAFLAARSGAYRELVAILRLCEETGLSRLIAALQTAERHRVYDIASIRALLAMDGPPARTPPALADSHLNRWPDTPVPAVASGDYDTFTAAAEVQGQ